MARDQFSDLRKAYAEAAGCSLRTAQRHSESNHPDWQKFIGATAAAGAARKASTGEMTVAETEALGAVSPFKPEEMPDFYDVPDADLHPVQRLEKEAWQLHSRTFNAWKEMAANPTDAALAIVYARELPKLRKSFDEARREREAWEVEQRIVVTLPEFQAFQSKFLTPLAELLKGIPMEVASSVNPDNPAFARQQLRDWLRDKAEPRIIEMLEAANDLQPAA